MTKSDNGYLANLDRAVESLGSLRVPDCHCSVAPDLIKQGQQRAHLLRARAVRLMLKSLRKVLLPGH